MREATQHIAVQGNRLRQLRWVLGSAMFAALAVALVNVKHFYLTAEWRPLSLEVMKLAVLGWVLRFAWTSDEDRHIALRIGIAAALVSFATDLAFVQVFLPH